MKILLNNQQLLINILPSKSETPEGVPYADLRQQAKHRIQASNFLHVHEHTESIAMLVLCFIDPLGSLSLRALAWAARSFHPPRLSRSFHPP